jgi:hypothetical protein
LKLVIQALKVQWWSGCRAAAVAAFLLGVVATAWGTPPSITKSFSPTTVAVNAPSTITFSITNSNAVTIDASFTDTLPSNSLTANLVVATTPNVVNNCGGSVTATAGSGTISFSNPALPAGPTFTCTITVDVQGTEDGVYSNSVTIDSSDQGNGNTSSDTLTVINPPSIAKAFGAATVPLNGTTSLTFTISSTNANLTVTGIAFTDNLPAGLVVATPGNLSATCLGSATAADGGSSVSLSGGSLAPGPPCTVSVSVTGTTAGVKNNSVSVNSDAGPGNTSNDVITVVSPPTISKDFSPTSISLNGTSTITFTVTNPNATVDLTGVAFTDSLPAGLQVASTPSAGTTCPAGAFSPSPGPGDTSLSFSGGTVTQGTNCTVNVNVTSAAVGTYDNTTGAISSTNGGTGTTSNTATLAVNKGDTATSLTSSANPSVFGQSVTFTATVSPVAPATGTPGGTVTFLDGGSPIGTASLSAGGVATFTTSALAVGNHTITTDYGGDASFNGSTGSLTGNPQVVNKADTTTAVTSSVNPSVFGQSVTFTATVSQVAPGAGTPGGTVTFLDGGNPIGTSPLSGGVATFTTSNLAVGNLTITTNYGGDGSFNSSTGSLTGNPQVVNKADTTTAVTSSANPSVFGQSVTFTATVSPVAPGAGTPTGTVTFLDGGSPIGTGTLSGGVATFATSALAVGNHTITTNYGGDASFNGSTGSLTGNPQVVNKANTTTAVTSSANPSVFGQSVTFTATVSPVAPGAGTPTGTVTFLDGGNPVGTGTLSGGVATFATSALAVGNHTITTSYGGDGNFNASTGPLTGNPQVVNKANTTTSVTSSVNPSILGQSVTFTATVSPVAPGAGTPTGTVTFLDGGNPIGTGTLSGGVATFATSALAAGNHTITASYGGDGNFNSSTGSLTGNPQVVISPPSIAKAFGGTIVVNQTTALTFTITNPPANTVALTGVGFTDTLPTGLVVATTLNSLPPSCGPGAITATQGTNVISLSGATIAVSGQCQFSVTIIGAAAAPLYTNTTNNVSSANGGPGNAATASLTVNKGDIDTTKVVTTVVANPVLTSGFVTSTTFTFSGTVSQTPQFPGAVTLPTGTVTLTDGATVLGCASSAIPTTCTGTYSANGNWTITTTQNPLAVGAHTITVTYGGDPNFNGGASSSSVTVGANLTTAAGTSASETIQFNSSVTTLQPCQAQPQVQNGPLCSPTSTLPATSVTIKVRTCIGQQPCNYSASLVSPSGSVLAALNFRSVYVTCLSLPAIVLLGLAIPAGGVRRRKWRKVLAFLGLVFMLAALLVGCGGNGFFNPQGLQPISFGTPQGTYLVPLQGTDSQGHPVAATIVVNVTHP